MGIRIGNEPVGAIGGMSLAIGKGKKSQYDAEVARKQAEADANREMQERLANVRNQLEREKMKEQRGRDERQQRYGQENIRLQGELQDERSRQSQEAIAQRQRETNEDKEEAKAQAIFVQKRDEGKQILKPYWQKELDKLDKLEIEARQNRQNPKEVMQIMGQIDEARFRISNDPKKHQDNPNAKMTDEDWVKETQSLQARADATGAEITKEYPDGTKIKYIAKSEQGKKERIQAEVKAQAKKEKILISIQKLKKENRKAESRINVLEAKKSNAFEEDVESIQAEINGEKIEIESNNRLIDGLYNQIPIETMDGGVGIDTTEDTQTQQKLSEERKNEIRKTFIQ